MANKTGQYSSVDELPDLLQSKKTDYKSVDELPDLKKKESSVSGGVGGTVGSSKAQSNVSIEPPNPKDNPFAIGQQFNQPQKLEAEKLDLSNTQKNAAIAEQIKTPLRRIPETPILDNTKIQKPISDIDANEAIARQQQHKKDLETAIDNTTLKVLKQKGIVAGKGSPHYEAERKKIEEKTKPTMIGGIVINGAEATYHKDKNGNIGLDRNLGFLEGIRKGFNSVVEGEDEANAFAEMDTKQKVEYANKQMEGKQTEYMEERGGVGELLGGAAPYLVKAAAAATLATAAGIAAPETGGASLAGVAPVLTVLLTAPDMIKQGAKDEIMTRYMQLKQENPFSKDEDLMKIAEQGEISGGIVGAAEALAFTTTLKLPILKDSKDVLTTYLKGVASSAVHLGGIMAGTTATKIAERKLEGYNVETDKAIDEITTAFTENATAGAILNGIISGAHILPKVVKSAFKYALKDTPTSEIKTALDANVQAGRITPEVAEQAISDIVGYKEALAKTADGLKPETQASVAGLIQARDNVAAEMATKDPTQRAVYEQKIEAYNKQIKKITETNDPLKYEIDEVTGNPIDKVAPKVEDTKLSEPIEGVDEQGVPIGDNVPPPTDIKVEQLKNNYTEMYDKVLNNPETREQALKEISDQWHDQRSRKLIEESITPEIIKEAKEKYPQEENSGLTIPEPKPTDVVVDNTTPKGNTSNVVEGANLDNSVKNTNLQANETGSSQKANPEGQNQGIADSPRPLIQKSGKEKSIADRVKQIEDISDPYDKVLQHFSNDGKIHGSAIESLFGGKDSRIRIKASTENERRARISLIGKDAPTIDKLAHDLWESDKTGKYTTEDYKDAIERVLGDYNSKAAMQKDLVERYDTEAAYEKYINQTFGEEAIDVVNKMSDAEINEILKLEADKENAAALENYIDNLTQRANAETKPIKNEEAQAPQNTKQTEGTIPTESKVDEVVSDSGKGEKGSKEPPPSEPTEPVGEGEGKKDGITHAAVEELRKIIGEPEYEGKPVEKHETLIEEAQKKIKENPNAANEVLDKMENNGKITNKDNAIMAIYKATIDAEMAKNPTPELLQRATRLSKALDVSGTELGKALESRKLVGQEDNLTNFLLDKQAAQGTALTETQLKSEAAKYEKLKEAHDALEKQLEVEREQHAKDIAEMGVNKAKAKAKRESKKSSEDYKKERKDTVEAARKALKDIRDNPQASAAPVFRELVAIAPHVKEYVNSLVSEGVDKLDNIVTAVHAEFKDVLEGLSKRDVLNIMAGDYNTKPKDQTRNEKANTARLLEREAKLLKELERERKGEEKAKSESQKTQSNRRIDELKEKIKEVRRQNKNREVDTESPEDMTAGEIEYNAKLQKSLTEKAQKLTNDIRDKKYLEEEPAKPVFKKSRKTQLLEDKVIDLENKIRHERSKDEYNKRSTLRKGFDKVMEVLGVRRLVQSALDMSVPFRQGATMLSPRKIDVWAKGFKANLQSVFNPKKFERIMSAIRNDPMYHEMVKDNIVFNDLGSADPNLHNEDFRKSFVYKIPILSEPLKASNRSADAFLNVARIEMYKKLRSNLEKRGLTRESDPKAFKFIGNWTMAMTGRGTMHSALEKPAMNAVLGNTFYGARLMASRFNLLNPVTYFDPRIPKEAKREAMKDMAAFTLTMVSVATALSYTTGAKISLDPDDSDFLQLRYGDKVYDISGGLANYVRTGLRILKAGYTKATGTKSQGDKSTDNAGKSVMNFFRNKLSPNTAYGVDAFFGGRYGNDFDKSDIYRIYPMYTEDFIQAIKEEGGLTATATVLLPNILGIGYGSYASKGQIDKKLDDLLERNMRSDEMNNEKIHNYKDGGRVITFEEFNAFADKRDEKIKKDIEVLFEKGIGGKPYKDLTQEQVVDETNFIKANATREVKKAMFGENKKDRTEKMSDKKRLEERKRQYKNN